MRILRDPNVPATLKIALIDDVIDEILSLRACGDKIFYTEFLHDVIYELDDYPRVSDHASERCSFDAFLRTVLELKDPLYRPTETNKYVTFVQDEHNVHGICSESVRVATKIMRDDRIDTKRYYEKDPIRPSTYEYIKRSDCVVCGIRLSSLAIRIKSYINAYVDIIDKDTKNTSDNAGSAYENISVENNVSIIDVRNEMNLRFYQEMSDCASQSVCAVGILARLVNVLNGGYYDDCTVMSDFDYYVVKLFHVLNARVSPENLTGLTERIERLYIDERFAFDGIPSKYLTQILNRYIGEKDAWTFDSNGNITNRKKCVD